MANERLPCLRSCFLFLYGWFLIKLYISYENWMYVKYVGNFFCLVCYNKHQFCLNTVNFPWSLIDETNLSRGFLKDFKKIYHEKKSMKANFQRAIQFLLILVIPSDVWTTDAPCRKHRSTWHFWWLFLTHQPTIFLTF